MLRRHSKTTINDARRMFIKEGLSFREIGRRLKVDNSTISTWCRNLYSTSPNTLLKSNEIKRLEIKNSEVKLIKNMKDNIQTLKIISAVIYGCEGAKYPSTKHLGFTNSEPQLVSSFINILRKCFTLNESKFRVHLQIHSNQDYEYLINYWSKILHIPQDKFYKPTITSETDKKHRSDYRGTCTVNYYDYKIQLKLIGIYEDFMRKFAITEGIPNGSGKSLLNFDA